MSEPESKSALDNSNEKKWNSLISPQWVTAIFQIILGASSLFYVSGYIVWSSYSYFFGYGYLPVMHQQYFIAGIIPVLFFGVMIFGVYDFYWASKYRPYSRSLSRFSIALFLFSLMLFAALVVLQVFFKNVLTSVEEFAFSLVILILFMVGFHGFFLKTPPTKLRATYILLLCVAYIVLLQNYSYVLFRYLPREFGGPKLFPITMDIKRKSISEETFLQIKVPEVVDSFDVFRSKTLYFINDGGDYVMVVTEDLDKIAQSRNHFVGPFPTDTVYDCVFQLKKEAITGIYPVQAYFVFK